MWRSSRNCDVQTIMLETIGEGRVPFSEGNQVATMCLSLA